MAVMTLDPDSFDKVVDQPGIVVIDWWARWCAPCRFFAPVFERVAAKNPDITFGKIDVDEQPRLASALGVQAMPTLSVFRDGLLLIQQAGAMPEPALEELLRRARGLDMAEVRRRLEAASAQGGTR